MKNPGREESLGDHRRAGPGPPGPAPVRAAWCCAACAFLAEATVADLRRFVLAVTLPSALFLTFLRVSLELRYLPVVLLVFGACVVMLLAGPGITRLVGVRSPFSGPLMTGFEAGCWDMR